MCIHTYIDKRSKWWQLDQTSNHISCTTKRENSRTKQRGLGDSFFTWLLIFEATTSHRVFTALYFFLGSIFHSLNIFWKHSFSISTAWSRVTSDIQTCHLVSTPNKLSSMVLFGSVMLVRHMIFIFLPKFTKGQQVTRDCGRFLVPEWKNANSFWYLRKADIVSGTYQLFSTLMVAFVDTFFLSVGNPLSAY